MAVSVVAVGGPGGGTVGFGVGGLVPSGPGVGTVGVPGGVV